MQEQNITFYDGQISKPYPATIAPIDRETVLICYNQQQRRYYYADMQLIGALGQIQPVIELKDDARIEFPQALPDWFELNKKHVQHSIWKLERSPSLILFSVVFVAAFIFAILRWGIPSAAHYVAMQLPADTIYKLGDEAQEQVFNLTAPSTIPLARQKQIIQSYQDLVANGQPAKVLFRAGGQIGTNALALPNNTIILTDELVNLAKDDHEIIGVLAHEQGHLVERHSLQQALSSLGFSVLLIAVTGDSSALFTTLPVALVGASYSRNFESDADLYAMQVLDKNHISSLHLANFLARMEDDARAEEEEKQPQGKSEEEEDGGIGSFFQSHPATQERIAAIRQFNQQQRLSN
ncbi:M48 family metallopeptidase [Acinetobacter johnsonii]|uniref:M48 family metallopeptidase n=1 Tax=Acinetobacter johnsonii TaxID=40214 RepID=UPI00244D1843|nr:M48 family metallopeptidase [Acinetobacter johnsonii]MDH1727176.1 M48 family metallopeptidase [Acinetobacter johnsonii]